MPYRDALTRRAARRKSYQRRKDKVLLYERRRRAAQPEAFLATKLMHRYGLTLERYRQLLESQGGLCALCKKRPAGDVDHCHATGKVRALLCRGCNVGLGLFGDDPDRLRAAIAYLEGHGAAAADASDA